MVWEGSCHTAELRAPTGDGRPGMVRRQAVKRMLRAMDCPQLMVMGRVAEFFKKCER
jgi:hypothetical protein